MVRTYSELINLKTAEERFEYLRIGDRKLGDRTFGGDRYINQFLYKRDNKWRDVRKIVIKRDCGYDLGLNDKKFEIIGPIIVHHMNPITKDDILNGSPLVYDPEYLISLSTSVHSGIHYGDIRCLDRYIKPFAIRSKNDTILW